MEKSWIATEVSTATGPEKRQDRPGAPAFRLGLGSSRPGSGGIQQSLSRSTVTISLRCGLSIGFLATARSRYE